MFVCTLYVGVDTQICVVLCLPRAESRGSHLCESEKKGGEITWE